MKEETEVRLEALKLVKDWSTGLLFVQSAAIGVVGALCEKHSPHGWLLGLTVALFASLVSSIYLGAVCVVGTLPAIAQRLPENPGCDIYAERGGLRRGFRPTLGKYCLWQAQLFILSLILFAVFAIGIA